MTKRARILGCSVAAIVFGGTASLVVAVFWPLLYPLSLVGSSQGEDAVVIALPASVLLFGVLGFALCWKLTTRFARKGESETGQRLLS